MGVLTEAGRLYYATRERGVKDVERMLFVVGVCLFGASWGLLAMFVWVCFANVFVIVSLAMFLCPVLVIVLGLSFLGLFALQANTVRQSKVCCSQCSTLALGFYAMFWWAGDVA